LLFRIPHQNFGISAQAAGKLPRAVEQMAACFVVVIPRIDRGRLIPRQRLALMYNPLGHWNAWFALSSQAARVCWEAQAVMLLRGLRMAQGGAKAEAQRMITEKVAALAEAQVAATVATLKGSKRHRVAKKALGVYARRVGHNRRRLSK
jgi:hypothetical protein